jgi:hypothetical protein
MLLNPFGFRLLAGIVLLSLSTTLMAQDATQSGTQVLTPFGYRDSANVHRVPLGYELNLMPDRHIRMENPVTGDHIDFPKSAAVNKGRAPFSDNGWVTYASWLNETRKPVTWFATTYAIPPAPTTYNGQTLFQFNSIEPDSYDSIVQPVLQYGPSAAGGGEYWAIASWYVVGNSAYYSSLTKMYSGQSLIGLIRQTGHSKRYGYSYLSQFYGWGSSTLTVNNIEELRWCTETLEVYGVTECSQFPNTVFCELYNINVQTKGIYPSVNWGITNAATSCGVQTTVVTNSGHNGGVNIYY